jgi:hypothetical protein
MAVLKYWDPTAGDYVALVAPISGTLIITGTTTPTSGIGVEGNFYLDATAHILYGPKTGATWPVAIAQGAAPAGPSEVDFSFVSATTQWVMVHNLNEWTVDVECWDGSGNEVIGDVDYVSANQVNVNWYAPMTGTAKISR